MFKVSVSAVAEMTKKEREEAEIMYLKLAYLYENDEKPSGSYEMRKSPERIVLRGYSYAERELVNSYKELFAVSSAVCKRSGKRLIGFVDYEEKTPKNAYLAWQLIYHAISKKGNERH